MSCVVFQYTAPRESILYNKLLKFDVLEGGVAETYTLPENNFFVTEGTCVPKVRAIAYVFV